MEGNPIVLFDKHVASPSKPTLCISIRLAKLQGHSMVPPTRSIGVSDSFDLEAQERSQRNVRRSRYVGFQLKHWSEQIAANQKASTESNCRHLQRWVRKCKFRAYSTSVKDVTGIKIPTFAQHSCQDGFQRARQHAHPIKRIAVKGTDLEQTALVPADLPRKPSARLNAPKSRSKSIPELAVPVESPGI
eukprot:IDg8276t1